MMTIAVHVEPFVAMHHELEAPGDQQAAWIATKSGVAVSRELADELGWKLGETTVPSGVWCLRFVPLGKTPCEPCADDALGVAFPSCAPCPRGERQQE